MKKKILFLICIFASITVFSQDITGKWIGSIEIQGQKLKIGFDIQKSGTGYIAKMDSPDQGAFGLPTTSTTFVDNQVEITATGLGIEYKGIWGGDSINGIFKQGGLSLPLVLKRGKNAEQIRPQIPIAPFPYHTEDVTIPYEKEEIELSGTLTLPDTNTIVPAVILIAGSGPNDRDETIFGHKPFLVMADYLTRNGIAVLRYDKRGTGKSTGNYQLATTYDFADDVKLAIEYLKKRKEIDKTKIGLIGHSEGGIIAPMVAADNKDVAFIVLMAGMGTKGIELLLDQNLKSMQSQNVEPETINKLMPVVEDVLNTAKDWEPTEEKRVILRDKIVSLWESLPLVMQLQVNKDNFTRSTYNSMVTPWFRKFASLEPTEYIKNVKCPVLAINGEKDSQVPADKNLKIIEDALTKGGNKRFVIKKYPNLNHLFQESNTGLVDEYVKIEQTISPLVMNDITEWIKKTIK